MSLHTRTVLSLVASSLLVLGLLHFASVGASAAPAPKHDRAVSATPAAWTPAVDNGSVQGFAQVGQTMVAVGDFTSVTPSGGSSVARGGAVAFNASTGALVAGLLFGVVQTLTIAYLPSRLSDIIIFSILFLVLLVKPNGLFGRDEAGAMRGRR